MSDSNSTGQDLTGEEIAALLHEVRQRVRARYPSASLAVPSSGPEPFRIPLPDLMPLVHARDAAQAKAASIGSVNPRAGGALNEGIQWIKRAIARSLAWFVRDQITFNRQIMSCVEASLQSQAEVNASLTALAARFGQRDEATRSLFEERWQRTEEINTALARDAGELKEIRAHWHIWRIEWEKKLVAGELDYQRALTELQTGFYNRAALAENAARDQFNGLLDQMDSLRGELQNARDFVMSQHSEFQSSLERANLGMEKRFWTDLEKVRIEYERLIHNELRLIRQRMRRADAQPAFDDPQPASTTGEPPFDYESFSDRFRGPEQYVRANQALYAPIFQGSERVLDLGCGRGEFLELMRERGISGRGVDLSERNVSYCRSRGLYVERADMFTYLEQLEVESEDAIFCGQVVEHLEPARVPRLIELCASRLRRDGRLVFETPNPECLAIFASHFYLDPTHTRPVPAALLSFYMEEAGMGSIAVHPIAPASGSFPEVNELPKPFARRFFGSLDYAISGVKL